MTEMALHNDYRKTSLSRQLLSCLGRLLDHRFLSRFRAGDAEAFEKIYKGYHAPIRNYVYERVRDPDCAEDIAQEVFLKAFKSCGSYNPHFGFSTWLWTIAKNSVTDWFRQQGRALVSPGHFRADDQPLDIEQIPCLSPSPEDTLQHKAHRKHLIKVMAVLTEMQKKVLILRMVHHLPYREIARTLDLSLSSVKCLASRAKDALLRAQHEMADDLGIRSLLEGA